MMRFTHTVWAPADDDAKKRPSEPSQQIPPQVQFSDYGGGTIGPTIDSRVGEALPGMGPADAADTGGMDVDPTVILPPEAGGYRNVGAGENAVRADLAPGGQPDNLLDVEDNPEAHLPQDMIENLGPRREE